MGKLKKLIREIKNSWKNYNEIEMLVREATSSDAWGPSVAMMARIARESDLPANYSSMFSMLWKRLTDYEYLKHVLKSLILIEYLLKNADQRFLSDIKMRRGVFERLQRYRYIKDGKEIGSEVRARARKIVELLEDEHKLVAARRTSSQLKLRLSSEGLGGGYHGGDEGRPSNDGEFFLALPAPEPKEEVLALPAPERKEEVPTDSSAEEEDDREERTDEEEEGDSEEAMDRRKVVYKRTDEEAKGMLEGDREEEDRDEEDDDEEEEESEESRNFFDEDPADLARARAYTTTDFDIFTDGKPEGKADFVSELFSDRGETALIPTEAPGTAAPAVYDPYSTAPSAYPVPAGFYAAPASAYPVPSYPATYDWFSASAPMLPPASAPSGGFYAPTAPVGSTSAAPARPADMSLPRASSTVDFFWS